MVAFLGLTLLAAAVQAASRPVEVKIVAAEFKFTPDRVTAPAGVPLRITLVNDGVIEHDLRIQALGVWLPGQPRGGQEVRVLAPGRSLTVTTTPTKKGSFEFWCTIPGHKEAGMKGTITIR